LTASVGTQRGEGATEEADQKKGRGERNVPTRKERTADPSGSTSRPHAQGTWEPPCGKKKKKEHATLCKKGARPVIRGGSVWWVESKEVQNRGGKKKNFLHFVKRRLPPKKGGLVAKTLGGS